MRVYLPHTGAAPCDWTLAWAQWYAPYAELVRVGAANDSYAQLFADWWERGEPFMIIEQDVVPWPGADRELEACPEPWCAMSYYIDDDLAKPTLGCVRFRPSGPVPFETAPDDIRAAFCQDGLPHWQALDMVIASSLRARGAQVHQHFPSVAHIKPAGYAMATVGFMGEIAEAG